MLVLCCQVLLLALLGAAHAQPLLVAAASDISPLEKDLTSGAKRAGLDVRFTFGSSGMLARQVENGAPFDLFLSANEQFVDELDKAGFASKRVTYAKGRLGLWSRSGGVRALGDLRQPNVRHIALANPKHAPYGMAAEELLRAEELWDTLRTKLVFGENVRQAFEFARTGNADAVITSWTLVHDTGGFMLLERHKPLRQAGMVVRGSKQETVALRFLDFLLSPAGQKILQSKGLFAPK